MSFLITAVLFAVSATPIDRESLAYAYWFGGHLVALVLALPMFLRLYRQRKGVEWTVILRSEWKGMLLWLVAAMIVLVACSWQFEKTYPATGLVSHLQTLGGLTLLGFYVFVAPIMAYYVSQWKKRTAAWAFFAFWPGPAILLILLLLPESEKAHGPIFSEGFIRFFTERRPASLYRPVDPDPRVALRKWLIDQAIYVVIGIVVLALLIWFVISTRPVPLE